MGLFLGLKIAADVDSSKLIIESDSSFLLMRTTLQPNEELYFDKNVASLEHCYPKIFHFRLVDALLMSVIAPLF